MTDSASPPCHCAIVSGEQSDEIARCDLHAAAAGLVSDHICRMPRCVNPAHIEAVTNRENTLRGLRGRLVTHCPQGHEYTTANTCWDQGRRRCRTCRDARNRVLQRIRNAEFWRVYRARRRAAGRAVGRQP